MAETILPLKINAKLSNEQLELFVDKLNEFDKETGLDTTLISMSAVARRVEARTSNEENTALPLHGFMPCLYKQSFIDRFNKYFEYKPKVYDYVGKNSKREYTLDDLHKEYEKAMGETPFK